MDRNLVPQATNGLREGSKFDGMHHRLIEGGQYDYHVKPFSCPAVSVDNDQVLTISDCLSCKISSETEELALKRSASFLAKISRQHLYQSCTQSTILYVV